VFVGSLGSQEEDSLYRCSDAAGTLPGAKQGAERVRWRGRSRNMSRASQSMDERLRKMNDQASTLDKRLSESNKTVNRVS
jgi:hypothetical protein